MKELLTQLIEGKSLTTEQTAEAFELIMTGKSEPLQVAAMLALIQQHGPTVDEIAGAAKVMRDKATAVTVPDGLTAIDTCGTGGDHSGTFNVSTAAAIVAAAAGRPKNICVAKHGNRSITSKSGSSQVLESLGVHLQVDGDTLTKCLDEAGLCFCFAPAHHPAMKHAMPIRQALGVRTMFNMLGPLTNPAGARRQIMGVFDASLTETLANVLCKLGAEDAMVVHGQGVDEIVTWGTSQISRCKDGSVTTEIFDPSTLGLSCDDMASLQANDPDHSASIIRSVLAGEKGGPRDLVAINAGAALVVAGVSDSLAAGYEAACSAIDSGSAKQVIEKLAELTQAAAR